MGTRSATGKVTISMLGTIVNTLDGEIAAQAQIGGSVLSTTFKNGVNANQFNRGFDIKDREISSGNNEVVDLYDLGSIDVGSGAGRDPVGQALAIEEIASILIMQTGGAGRLEVEPDATNGWNQLGSHTVSAGTALHNGGALFKSVPSTEGMDVADASAHRIKLTANGGDVTYRMIVFARHDDDESSSSSSQSSSSSSSNSSSSSSSTSSDSSSSSSSESSSASSSST